MNAGQLFIITAPSGTGKTTLIKRALAEINNLAVSISYTTRKKRPSEKNGKIYHFVSQEEFKEKVKVGAFAEYADVFGHLYGTAWQDLVDLRAKQVDVILELDYQTSCVFFPGGRRFRNHFLSFADILGFFRVSERANDS